jgi:hypothetical protein
MPKIRVASLRGLTAFAAPQPFRWFIRMQRGSGIAGEPAVVVELIPHPDIEDFQADTCAQAVLLGGVCPWDESA